MKEHIDEMTKVLVDYTKKNHIMASHAILEDYAEQLYEEGYRKQEWISVDERLPETNEEVLVYSSVGKIYTACYIRVDGIEFWFENIDGFREITHWMPLPEAPKMKGEKNG